MAKITLTIPDEVISTYAEYSKYQASIPLTGTDAEGNEVTGEKPNITPIQHYTNFLIDVVNNTHKNIVREKAQKAALETDVTEAIEKIKPA